MNGISLLNQFELLPGFEQKRAAVFDSGASELEHMRNAIAMGYGLDNLRLGAKHPTRDGVWAFAFIVDAGEGEYLVGAESDALGCASEIVADEKLVIERVKHYLSLMFKPTVELGTNQGGLH